MNMIRFYAMVFLFLKSGVWFNAMNEMNKIDNILAEMKAQAALS